MIVATAEDLAVRHRHRYDGHALTAEYPDLMIRVVVARHAGIFVWLSEPNGNCKARVISADEAIGTIDCLGQTVPVQSPFAGRLGGPLVVSGERVRSNQALAWLSLV